MDLVVVEEIVQRGVPEDFAAIEAAEGVHEFFRVATEADAEWALELRSRIEGEIAGLDARIAGLTEQLRALRREQERRLAWWEWRFGRDLIAFAREHLPRRSKTWRCAWGCVRFRKSPGTTQILDMDRAVEWVEAWAPEHVKRSARVTIEGVRAACAAAAMATGEVEQPDFLKATGETESVMISTGVDAKGGD